MIQNIHQKLTNELGISSFLAPTPGFNFENHITSEIQGGYDTMTETNPLDSAVVSFLNHVIERLFTSTMSMHENNLPLGGSFFPSMGSLPQNMLPSVTHSHRVDRVSESPFGEEFAVVKAKTAHKPPMAIGSYVDSLTENLHADLYNDKGYDSYSSTSSHGYDHIVEKASNKYGVDAKLVNAVIKAESAGNARAVSPVGARGLMQLMPATARELGVSDSFDPEQNVMGGTKYLSQLLKRYHGNRRLALAAYNWGMGNVEKRLGKMPSETRNYIATVEKYYKQMS